MCKHVNFYQWTTFLQQFFKSIPNILQYHRFFVDAKKPGVVTVRETALSTDSTVNILKVDHQFILDAGMPQLTNIKGLDAQRQWYLFEQIRPFCKTVLSADFTCPEPSCPKPAAKSNQTLVSTIPPVSTVTQTATPAASDRGKRKCSVCHKIGHTKRTCKGINRS